MKRVYLLASVGIAALVSSCATGEKKSIDQEQSLPQTLPQKTESAAFFDVVVLNTRDGYREYLRSYPSGRYFDIALDLLTICTTGTCASDTQLQMALSNAVAISRSQGQGASGARDTAVEQFTADSGQLAISEPSDSHSGGNY
jgi:hypothetical protein